MIRSPLARPLPGLALLATAWLLPSTAPAQNFFATPGRLDLGTPTGSVDRSISMNGDETVVVFASNRPGGKGGQDLWMATRADANQKWGTATPIATVNSSGDDLAPTLRADGLELVFASRRPGNIGVVDLYAARRTSTSAPWSLPRNLGTPFAAAGRTLGEPQFTGDGLRLFYSSDQAGGGDIVVATRAGTSSRWSSFAPFVPANDPAARDAHPMPDENGSVVWWSSDRAGGKGGLDVYMTWFDLGTRSWSTPLAVTELNTGRDDDGMFLGAPTGTTYINAFDVSLGPIVNCICRGTTWQATIGSEGPVVRSLASPGWTAPVTWMRSQSWQTGTTARLGYYDWPQSIDPASSWVLALGTRDVPLGIFIPGRTYGALELDPTVMVTLPAVPAVAGLTTQSLPIPNDSKLRGATVFVQAIAITKSLRFSMAPPARVRVR